MANPQVPQGTLNRLKVNVTFNDYPALNVTASFLAPEGVNLAFEGEGAILVPTLTGAAQSPEPFMMARATINLLKTQALADAFKSQLETDTNLGPVSIFGDTSTLSEYDLVNCVLQGVQDIKFNGTTVGYAVRIHGIYPINSDLWNQ